MPNQVIVEHNMANATSLSYSHYVYLINNTLVALSLIISAPSTPGVFRCGHASTKRIFICLNAQKAIVPALCALAF